jgi:hypothetical protein
MSQHDRAVGFFYPLGAAAGRQVAYPVGEFPTYAGMGMFGARGPPTTDLRLLDVDRPYDFLPGQIYNLECSHVIASGVVRHRDNGLRPAVPARYGARAGCGCGRC